MRIQRTINGVNFSFELLPCELVDAYYEQQKKFDIEDVIILTEYNTDEDLDTLYGCDGKFILDHKKEIANLMRKYIDKYDLDWVTAREEAVRDLINEKSAVIT